MVCNDTKCHYSRKDQRSQVWCIQVKRKSMLFWILEIENDMSCTATIKEDGDYRVKITRANEVGETVNDSFTFPCEFIL